MSEDKVPTARNLVDKAEQNLKNARENADNLPHSSQSNVVKNSQLCMEQSIKSLFLFVDMTFPEIHEISLEEELVKNLIRKANHGEFPDRFPDSDIEKLPRLVTATHMWSTAYQSSKYPVQYEDLTIKSDDVFSVDDARKAVADAEDCYYVAVHMRNAVE